MAKKLGERLVEAGLATPEAVEQALQHQQVTGHRLGDCLVELKLVEETALLRFLAAELKTRFVSAEKLSKARVPTSVLDRVPVRMAEAHLFLPVAVDAERRVLSIVMAEPQNTSVIHEIARLTDMEQVFAFVSLRSAVLAGIRKHYYGDPTAFSSIHVGPQALRADISSIASAFEQTPGGSPSNPEGVAPLDTDPRAARALRPSHSARQPTKLREVLGAVRGLVGDNDFLETLNILVGLLELQHGSLRGHSAQLARQAVTLARHMGLLPRDISNIAIAAYLHDVPKHPARHYTLASNAANPEWKSQARKSTQAPIKLFETVHLPAPVNTILAQRFEAFDGSGTPGGARGEDIALGARILAAVDSYLDLTRNPDNALGRLLAKDEALAHLSEQAGRLYDPEVIGVLLQLQTGALLRRRLESEGRQVLVADPNERVRRALLDVLSQHELATHAAAKLDGAIDAVLSGDADVLVLGSRFGVADVAAVIQFLRAQPECSAIPLLVLGEPTDAAGRDKLLQAGASELLPLPLEAERTGAAVLRHYRERVELGGPGRVVRGSFDELPPEEVLRCLGKGRKSGRLLVRGVHREGYLHLEQGVVVFATFAGEQGEEAVKALLSEPQADFSYDPEALLMEPPHLSRDLEEISAEVWPSARGVASGP